MFSQILLVLQLSYFKDPPGLAGKYVVTNLKTDPHISHIYRYFFCEHDEFRTSGTESSISQWAVRLQLAVKRFIRGRGSLCRVIPPFLSGKQGKQWNHWVKFWISFSWQSICLTADRGLWSYKRERRHVWAPIVFTVPGRDIIRGEQSGAAMGRVSTGERWFSDEWAITQETGC